MKDDWLFLQCKLIKIFFPFIHLSCQIQKCWFGRVKPNRLKGKMWSLVRKGMRKGYCRTRSLELQQRLQRSGGRTRKKGPTASGPVWPVQIAVLSVRPIWPVRPVNLGIPPELKTRRGRASKSSWPNMRKREPSRNRKSNQSRLRIWNHRRNVKSDQVKVIMPHPMDQLLHGIAGVLTFIRL